MSVRTISPNAGAVARFFAWAVTPRGAITIWCGYVLANALIRYSLSHTLSNDDTVESIAVQDLLLGYRVRNPPLWEWLLWTIQQVIGPSFASHLILRYGCLVLVGVAVFRASRLASGDARWAAAVTLTIPLFHQVGWPLFEWGTHTLLLLIICLFSFEIALRYAQRPSYAAAAGLGVLIGLGFLAKYGYAFFILALIAALLLKRETRGAILRRELLLAPVVALLVASPFLYWLVATGADLAATADDTFVRDDTPWIERALYGLRKLVENSTKFILPWSLVAGLAIWFDRRLGVLPAGAAGPGEPVLKSTLLLSFGMATIGVIIIGPTNFTGGYVVPVLVTALPYGACLLARYCRDEQAPLRFAAIGIVVLACITLLRLAYLSNSGFPENSYRRDMWPIDGLAAAMRDAGMDRGTLVTVNWREGGNLRAALPGIRVVSLRQGKRRPSISGDQRSACRLLWNDTETLFPGERWARTGDAKAVASQPQIAGRERRHFDIAWAYSFLGNQRVSRWTIVELAPDDPLCR